MKYRALLRTPHPSDKVTQTHSNNEAIVLQWATNILLTAPKGSYVNIYVTEEKLFRQLGKLEEAKAQ